MKFTSKCYKCHATGHKSNQCYAKNKDKRYKDRKFEKKKPGNDHNKQVCYYCSKPNHYSKDCRTRLCDEAQNRKTGGNASKVRTDSQKIRNMKEDKHVEEMNPELSEIIENLKDRLYFLGQAEALVAD